MVGARLTNGRGAGSRLRTVFKPTAVRYVWIDQIKFMNAPIVVKTRREFFYLNNNMSVFWNKAQDKATRSTNRNSHACDLSNCAIHNYLE